MRVAITGAHSCGKTTLATSLVKILNSSEFTIAMNRSFIQYPEFAREILDELSKFDSTLTWQNMISNNPMQYLMFENLIATCYSEQCFLDFYIADRTPLDILAYIDYAWSLYKDKASDFMIFVDDLIRENLISLLQNVEYDILIYLRLKDKRDESRVYIDEFISEQLDNINATHFLEYDEKPKILEVGSDVKRILQEIFERDAYSLEQAETIFQKDFPLPKLDEEVQDMIDELEELDESSNEVIEEGDK